jgi:hypothetical protein
LLPALSDLDDGHAPIAAVERESTTGASRCWFRAAAPLGPLTQTFRRADLPAV